MDLLNVSTGSPESIPDDGVHAALAAGTHMPTGGARALINPDGKLVFSPATDLQENVARFGYRVPTQDDLNQFAKEQKYGLGAGNVAQAALEEAGRTASFGATDYLLPGLGITTKEALAGRKEEFQRLHPVGAFAAGAAGAIASSALIPGGGLTGALAKGTGAVGKAAAGALSRAAGAVTREGGLAAKILGSGAEVAGHAIGSGIEGGVYGIGQTVSEAELGDPDLTGEKVLSNVGYGALFGGALGGMLKAGLMAVPASLGKAQEAVGNFYEKWIGKNVELPGPLEEGAERAKAFVPGKLSEAWAKASSMASGEPEDAILQKMTEARNPSGIPMTPAERDAFATQMADSLQEHYSAVDKASKDASGRVRPQESATLLADADPAKALDALDGTRNVLKAAVAEMRASPELYPGRFPAKVQQILDGLEDKTHELTPHPEMPEPEMPVWEKLGGKEYVTHEVPTPQEPAARFNTEKPKPLENLTAADIFKAINETKQAIDSNWKKEYGAESSEAMSLIKNLRSTVKGLLEHEPTWGEAASRQAAYNDALSAQLTAKAEFQKQLMRKVKTRSGGTSYKVDPIKVNSWFNMINGPRGQPRTQAFREYLETSRNLVKEIGTTYESAPFEHFDKEGMQSLLDRTEAGADKAHQIVQAQPGGRGFFTDIYSGAKPIVAYALGGPLGAAGAMAAGAFSAVRNPQGAIERLVKLEQSAAKATQFVKTASKAVFDVSKEAVDGVPGAGMVGQKLAPDALRERFERRRDDIRDQNANPQQTLDKTVWATNEGFHAAPQVMGAIQRTAFRGSAFLNSKIPEPPGKDTPFSKAPEVSSADILKFDRYYDAVHDPLSVIKQLGRGPVSDEATEALGAVYPKLFSEMQREVASELLAHGKLIPYQRRLAICSFIGQPLESSLSPQNILANQIVLNKKQAQNDQKEAQAENPRINVAGRYSTAFQQASQPDAKET